MVGPYSFRFGEVLAVHGRMPTTPRTLNGQTRTRAGQLVEWDICGIQSLVTTKTYRCLFDEQIPKRSRNRNYVVLFSKADQRPSNARRKCGVAWLPADPAGDGAGRTGCRPAAHPEHPAEPGVQAVDLGRYDAVQRP